MAEHGEHSNEWRSCGLSALRLYCHLHFRLQKSGLGKCAESRIHLQGAFFLDAHGGSYWTAFEAALWTAYKTALRTPYREAVAPTYFEAF